MVLKQERMHVTEGEEWHLSDIHV